VPPVKWILTNAYLRDAGWSSDAATSEQATIKLPQFSHGSQQDQFRMRSRRSSKTVSFLGGWRALKATQIVLEVRNGK
jgi:hypothetical protein